MQQLSRRLTPQYFCDPYVEHGSTQHIDWFRCHSDPCWVDYIFSIAEVVSEPVWQSENNTTNGWLSKLKMQSPGNKHRSSNEHRASMVKNDRALRSSVYRMAIDWRRVCDHLLTIGPFENACTQRRFHGSMRMCCLTYNLCFRQPKIIREQLIPEQRSPH